MIKSFFTNRIWSRLMVAVFALLVAVGFGTAVNAIHSWGPYHWARTANPFTLKLGDNVPLAWDTYLTTASSDWSLSSVLDTSVVAGGTRPKTCRPTAGRVEVCAAKYGNNGWLGLAQIWITGGEHITKGAVKLNDTYFSKPAYNTSAWKSLVMCQEVGHTFGLDHQDENFSNPNLGTCMDYTSDPDGPPSNEHPNAHDFEQLELIYAHLDSITTVSATAPSKKNGRNQSFNFELPDTTDPDELREWGRVVRRDARNRASLYERDLGRGEKVLTHVLWAE
ncbi:MAG: hypothetical protein A2W52_02315 [Candidatus Taylorbacteria bacterium RIFCSPHIGHO2_02_49_25]|uniref:Peptidase M10 metallopeptidase domain-containing protein n=1 Tax=Candidatus Taylorbacteria bacterium RIFCSPHIGHO2_02_49_25 TaxID=1802305 RepID=A0A1G2MD75_9BACT|nr:MAG: hypothetical protein A2759_01435 [Candidatus Taylorbacteria bacterium RIFCSPHIGHO2_01_FULL_49_60]OHA21773.1 MAG: hypothetical protein A2W52_02315 [Candidatus Taylorbacteria bacterium RIFCSPHIGHO2_02_49_25]OHA35470.1 MAG: hypothetical protein A2W65_00425 [Candidatus Taylorbacteria bacterium RIFCSPLOWO2_02_50_13]OHA37092.1 MAG: hypothetical protein A3B27_01600 [Candidatus Taylorbacteria bacterium RIFCSPLOWO2_01_FULL_50_130]OHA40287.1 MAG: hypothetical protein A3H73_00795 [Candidatus Taylo